MNEYGLIIGKFYPFHTGHQALIDYALEHCKHLTIFIGARSDEKISMEVRIQWLEDHYVANDRVKVVGAVADHLPEPGTLSSSKVSELWSEYISKHYGRFDIIIGSEDYVHEVAEYTTAKGLVFDIDREQYPITATEIRKEPMVHWRYLPHVTRQYFLKTICIFGPESTGKSMLTEKLAKYFGTIFVPEIARDILGNRHCREKDFNLIGIEHAAAVYQAQRDKEAHRILFVDTDTITTRVFHDVYYPHEGLMTKELLSRIEAEGPQYDFYFLCDVDVPWVPDTSRDLGDVREEMFDIYKQELEKRSLNYVILSGDWDNRWKIATDTVNKLLGEKL